MGEGVALAAQVCWNCKNGKRKCTKELPACARCSKLLLKCDYDWVQGANVPETTNTQTQSHASPASSVEGTPLPHVQTASKLMQSLSDGSPKSPSIDANIPAQVLTILISYGEGVPSVTSTYFRTIDVWLPIIERERCMKRLESIGTDHNVELASLLLCMYLVTRPPGNSPGIKEMQSSIYFDAKALITALTGAGRSSIEVIQGALLISLYEQGHGMIEAAQLTMAVCSRMAMKMKVEIEATTNVQNTEFGLLWWGIITLDRHLNQLLSADEISLVLGSSSDGVPSMELPVDDEVPSVDPSTFMRTASGISASGKPTTRLGPFCRAAEAGHLLGKTLELVAQSSLTLDMDQQKAQVVDKELQELGMVLLQQAVNGWEECCAAIGLCLRYSASSSICRPSLTCCGALLLLHLRTFDLYKDKSSQDFRKEAARMALSSAARMTIDISRRFHMDLAFIDLPALPLPATYCVFRASLLYIEFAENDFMNSEWTSNMDSLKGALGHFGKRWNVGKHYLELIDIAISDEIKARARANEHSPHHVDDLMKMEINQD